MVGLVALSSLLLITYINATATTYTDLRGIGSYSEEVYPLCQENELFVNYRNDTLNDFKAEYGLQTRISMEMLKDKKC